MSRLRRTSGEEEAEIDLTPMLDVVFIMLIFFIVTASFVKETGIEISRPDSANNPPPPDSEDKPNIIFQVSANNEIWSMDEQGARRIDSRAVRAVIEQKSAENPAAAVIIQANPEAEAETYASIADAARSVNMAIPLTMTVSEN